MVIERRSALGEATVIHRAIRYFVGELGMQIVSQTKNAISFTHDDSTVNITVAEDGPDSTVQIIAEGGEDAAAAFAESVDPAD